MKICDSGEIIFKNGLYEDNGDLYFYNQFHNGDIHYSREFVKDIIKKTKFKNYYYAHCNKTGILKDILELKEIKFELNNELQTLDYFIKNGDTYINTWIGQSKFKYLSNGLNINSLYDMYRNTYQFLNINLNEDIDTYIPRINYDMIDKLKIDSFINKNKMNILVCNGSFNSKQSTEQKFDPFIIDLAEKFPDSNYIFTNKNDEYEIKSSNVYYTNDIIGIDTSLDTDLIEISYLSKFCNIIIGKESGPFVFATTYDNLMDKNKTFLNVSNDLNWIFYPKGNCDYIWSNNYEYQFMYELIKETIENKFTKMELNGVFYKDLGKPGHGMLGNQLFEISATISLAKENNTNAYFPFWKYNHYFKNGIMTKEESFFNVITEYHDLRFEYNKIPYSEGMNLHGYFQSEKYFKMYEKEIRDTFELKEEYEIMLKQKWEHFLNTNTVSIHVRRGDYLNNPTFHVCPPMSYFKKSLRYIECVDLNEKIDNVLIFSDDIEWCKDNFTDNEYKYNFIEGQNDIEDLFLMSYCNHNIITNSSFSWWGSWLNKNINKIVCAPHRWFGDEWKMNCKDIYFDGVKIINYDVTSISDESLYANIVATSLRDLRNFKRDDIYRRILEHADEVTGQMYYDIICQKYPHLIKHMNDFKTNDDIGNPIKFKYGEYEMSPTTLRYVKVLGDIISIFGDLNDINIIEIGSGYGGQCKIIYDLFKPKTYTIVDLDEVMELNKMYLSHFNINNVIYKSSSDTFLDNYDLIISNYAFTECERTIQEIYLNKIIKNSKNGYITCNFISDSFDVKSFNKEDVLNMLDVSYQIIPEEPITHVDNFILTWKKQMNIMNEQKIYVFSVCFNEEDILPFYLDYYINFIKVDKIIIYDGGSTDRTHDIISKYPQVELIVDPQKDYSDKYLIDMKNSIWKKYKNECDWIIVCDIDEFLYHPNLRDKLLEYDKEGVTIPLTSGFDMISLDFPKYEKGKYLTDIVRNGIPDNHWLAKKIIFKSSLIDINYQGGSHDCEPIGNVKYSHNSDFFMLHYKWLSYDYMTNRYNYLNKRRSDWNIQHNASEHWNTFSLISTDDFIKKFNISVPFFKMEHFYENIFGWFDFQEIYSNMVNQFPSGSHFVEIGAWLGCSTSYMAVEIFNSNKNIKFDVIDTWEGSKNFVDEHVFSVESKDKSPFDIFEDNLKSVKEYINPIKGDSKILHKNYNNDSLDFVFIDGGHDYDTVKRDIINWYPKLKKNGFIGGHDYAVYESVRNAVDEFFGDSIKTIKTSWIVDINEFENSIQKDPEKLKIWKLKKLENFMYNEKYIDHIELKNIEEDEFIISYLLNKNYIVNNNTYIKPIDKPIYIFSHNYLINNWKNILNEQLYKLKKSGLYTNVNKIFLYCFGDDREFEDLNIIVNDFDINNKIEIKKHSDNFYEYHTLQDLWNFCNNNEESHILYFHLKGVWSRYNIQTGQDDEYDPTKPTKNIDALTEWRNCMEYFNIERWYNAVDKLNEGYEVVGALYNYNPDCPLFTGNFWWANSNYIKKLEYIDFEKEKEPYDVKIWIRIKCEKWINSINNKYYNLYNPKDLDLYHYVINPIDYRDDINPLISVLTPTYNRYDELKNAINSVIDQTYNNWEMLVCSDGEDDNVKNIIESYNNNLIKYYYTERTNNWGSTQRNFLTKTCGGKYVIYLDDDNILYPNALQDIINNIDENTGMIISKIDYDGLYYQLPIGNEITLGKIDTLNAVVDKRYIKYISWKNYVGHDYEFIKICENNVLNDNKNVKFIPNTIGRHVDKFSQIEMLKDDNFEIILKDKIYLTSKIDINNVNILFKIENGNIIYSFNGHITNRIQHWFIPDDRSFLNGVIIEINSNNQLIFKSNLIKRIKTNKINNKIAIFHHNYLRFKWLEILTEQIKELKNSGLYESCNEIIATIYSEYEDYNNRKIFKDYIKSEDYLNKWTIIDLYENNFEYDTLKLIKKYCNYKKEDINICYFHLKSVCSQTVTPLNIGLPYWRKYLNYFTINKWKENNIKLNEYDVIAVDYEFNQMHQTNIIGGNFFWTKSSHIKKLDDILYTDNRYLTEKWITSKECEVYSNFYSRSVGINDLYLECILPDMYVKDKIALVCIAKDEDYYIEEWLKYNHKLGFDNIFLFENNWECKIDLPYLTKIKWPGEYQQLLAYNYFIDTYGDNYDYAAFFDCDEFLVLKKHNNIHDFVKEYGGKNICINWQFYGSGGKEKRESNSVIKQFTRKQKDVDHHIKSIIYLKINQWMERGHNPDHPTYDTNGKEVKGPWNEDGPTDIAIINHYKDKTKEDYEIFIQRGQVDVSRNISIEDWEERKNIHIDVEDFNARDFLYSEKMEHFYDSIPGWSTETDQGELLKVILQYLDDDLKIAEIGVYQGRQTAMWNTILMNSNKKYEYYAIDNFLNLEQINFEYFGNYEKTLENLEPIKDKVFIIKNDSLLESEKYEDEYFDIIYIDASHQYEDVRNDIKHWYPKLKYNGIICGDDYIAGWPGVVQAVDEYFKGNINTIGNQQWWHMKKNDTIDYLSGGLLGDFIHQLSVINENYIKTGKKGNLYIFDNSANILHTNWALGIDKAYNDIKDIILKQDYISSFKIYKNDTLNNPINLSTWINSPLLYQVSFKEIFSKTYDVEWGKNKWLDLPTNDKYKDCIIVSLSKKRFNQYFNFNDLNKYNKKIYFATTNIEEYDNFKKLTNCNFDLLLFDNLLDFWTTINSCYLFVSNLSSFSSIALSLHKNHIALLPNNEDDILLKMDLKNFYWYENENENNLWDLFKKTHISIFHHNYLVNNWYNIVEEEISEICKSGLYDDCDNIHTTVFSNDHTQYELFYNLIGKYDINNKWIIYKLNENNFEIDCLKILYEYCQNNNCRVLYFNNKGVTHDKPSTKNWREYLIHFNINQYKKALDVLKTHDAYGIDLHTFPYLHYSGNFWWANSNYIKSLDINSLFLDEFENKNNINIGFPMHRRHNCEMWIGKGEGKLYSAHESNTDFYNNSYNSYKECNKVYIITSHPNYKMSEDITIKTIDNLKSMGETIILSSHCPVKSDIQKLSDYFIYDKNNPLIRHDFFTQSWFTTNEYYALLNITKNDNNFNHALGVFLNYYNSMILAKSQGYKIAVCTNFDMVFSKEDMKVIDNKINEMVEKDKKAFFMNTPEREGIHYKTIFFITDIDYFLNTFKYITDEKTYTEEMKKVGSNTNCLENFFYHTLKDKTNDLLLQEINEEQLFPTSQINLFSLIEYNTILPVENEPDKFIIWFSSANSLDSRFFNIAIRKNGRIILNEIKPINKQFIYYKKVKFTKGDSFEINFRVINDNEILKNKIIKVNDEVFRDINSYGNFIDKININSI